LPLKGYGIQYARKNLGLKLISQIPKMLFRIRQEHSWLRRAVAANDIDAVISDNRFGLYHEKIPAVFITHQLQIKSNFLWLDKKLQRLNYNYITRFNECWIPDFEGKLNLAGELSHPEKMPVIPVKYIGALSRFSNNEDEKKQFKWMAIISGPEPQRSIFERKVFEVASKTKDKFFIVRGLPGNVEQAFNLPNCKVFNHLNTSDMQSAIESSEYIISRCGYTTVMEILSLQKKSVFIPTPGQTEQEYLAKHLLQQKWSYTFNQGDDFLKQLDNANTFSYQLPKFDMNLHKEVIENFVATLR